MLGEARQQVHRHMHTDCAHTSPAPTSCVAGYRLGTACEVQSEGCMFACVRAGTAGMAGWAWVEAAHLLRGGLSDGERRRRTGLSDGERRRRGGLADTEGSLCVCCTRDGSP